MILFCDSSAWAKLYVAEKETEFMMQLVRRFEPVLARLTEVEVASVFARLMREGSLSASRAEELLIDLRRDAATLRLVELTQPVSRVAQDLLHAHRLRAGDAIQLASADSLRHANMARVLLPATTSASAKRPARKGSKSSGPNAGYSRSNWRAMTRCWTSLVPS